MPKTLRDPLAGLEGPVCTCIEFPVCTCTECPAAAVAQAAGWQLNTTSATTCLESDPHAWKPGAAPPSEASYPRIPLRQPGAAGLDPGKKWPRSQGRGSLDGLGGLGSLGGLESLDAGLPSTPSAPGSRGLPALGSPWWRLWDRGPGVEPAPALAAMVPPTKTASPSVLSQPP